MDLNKKFSFGLTFDLISSGGYSDKQLESFLKSFSPYIDNAYFSPPFPDKVYHSRSKIGEYFERDVAAKEFRDRLDLLEEYDVKFKLCLNAGLPSYLSGANEAVSRYIEMVEKAPDRIVCMARYGESLNKAFPNIPLTYSYNNAVTKESDIEAIPSYYENVVLGNAVLRDLDFMQKIQTAGFKVEHLVNNGCIWGCSFCRGWTNPASCSSIFPKYIEKMPIEYIYAASSILPSELHGRIVPSPQIDSYKISSRPSSIDYLFRVFESYIGGVDNLNSPKDLALWARLAQFKGHYAQIYKNFDKVKEYKEQLWVDCRPSFKGWNK